MLTWIINPRLVAERQREEGTSIDISFLVWNRLLDCWTHYNTQQATQILKHFRTCSWLSLVWISEWVDKLLLFFSHKIQVIKVNQNASLKPTKEHSFLSLVRCVQLLSKKNLKLERPTGFKRKNYWISFKTLINYLYNFTTHIQLKQSSDLESLLESIWSS